MKSKKKHPDMPRIFITSSMNPQLNEERFEICVSNIKKDDAIAFIASLPPNVSVSQGLLNHLNESDNNDIK